MTPKQNPVWSPSTASELTAGIPTQAMGFRELGKLMSQHDDYDCSQSTWWCKVCEDEPDLYCDKKQDNLDKKQQIAAARLRLGLLQIQN